MCTLRIYKCMHGPTIEDKFANIAFRSVINEA